MEVTFNDFLHDFTKKTLLRVLFMNCLKKKLSPNPGSAPDYFLVALDIESLCILCILVCCRPGSDPVLPPVGRGGDDKQTVRWPLLS